MAPFTLHIVPVTPFQQNCTILTDTATKIGAVIDPGGDLDRVEAAIAQSGATIEKIVLTHGHFDHAGGATDLAEKLGIAIEGPHRADAFLLDELPQSGARFGVSGLRAVTPSRWLDDGETLTIGGIVFDVLHCPGHSPGSVVFVWRKDPASPQGFAIVGDVLFKGSVGRTDLPGGDHATLIASIKTKLMPLSDDTVFLCGHGPMSSIGAERKSNPFLV